MNTNDYDRTPQGCAVNGGKFVAYLVLLLFVLFALASLPAALLPVP